MNVSGLESQLSDCNPLVLKTELFFGNVRKTKRTAKFDGLEPRRCKNVKGIVAPETGPKSFETFEKQAPGHQLNSCFDQSKEPVSVTDLWQKTCPGKTD